MFFWKVKKTCDPAAIRDGGTSFGNREAPRLTLRERPRRTDPAGGPGDRRQRRQGRRVPRRQNGAARVLRGPSDATVRRQRQPRAREPAGAGAAGGLRRGVTTQRTKRPAIHRGSPVVMFRIAAEQSPRTRGRTHLH